MKTSILVFLALYSVASAQQSAPVIPLQANPQAAAPAGALPENYVLTLSIDRGESGSSSPRKTDQSLVTASTDIAGSFAITPGSIQNFVGTLTLEKDNMVLFRYRCGNLQASVFLQMGVPVEVYKQDNEVCTLSINRLADQQPKSK